MKNTKNRKEMDPISLWGVTLASLLLVVLLCVVTASIDRNHPSFTNPKAYPYDLHKYIFMANHPFQLRIAPFCYRILLPLIVRLLPLNLFHAFYLMTVISLVVTAVVIFFILWRLRFNLYGCWLGIAVFFATGYLAKFNIFVTWHVDAFSYVFVALGLWFIVNNKPVWLAVTLLVGILAKETVLFVLPLYYTFHTDRIFNKRLFIKTFWIGMPAVCLWLAVHLAFPPLNQDERYLRTIPYEVSVVHVISDDPGVNRTYEPGKLLSEIGLKRLREFSAGDLKRYLFGVWGGLLLLVAAAPRKNLRWLLKGLPFLLLVHAQLLFGTNTERLLALSFPVVIPMIVSGFLKVGSTLHVHPLFLFLLPSVYFILGLSLGSDVFFSPDLRTQFAIFIGWIILLFAVSDLSEVAHQSSKP